MSTIPQLKNQSRFPNKNVNSMQNLLKGQLMDVYSHFSLNQMQIDQTLHKSWTNSKKMQD